MKQDVSTSLSVYLACPNNLIGNMEAQDRIGKDTHKNTGNHYRSVYDSDYL